MPPRSTAPLCISAVLVLAASNAAAIGFGKPTTTATLGQPLNFTVVLRQGQDEFIDAECVTADVMIGDSKVPPQRLRYSVEGPANSTERVLRITSSVVVDEPIITVSVQVGCPPTLNRAFTALADPPLVQLANQAQPGAARAAAAAGSTAPQAVRTRPRRAAGPRPAEAPAATAAAPRRARSSEGIGAPLPRAAAASVPAARASAPAVASSVRRSERAPADRLRLDPNASRRADRRPPAAVAAAASASPLTSSGQVVAAAAAPAAAAAAAASAPAPAPTSVVATAASAAAAAAPGALALPSAAMVASAPLTSPEAERLRVLEESLSKLKADAATQAADIATLRARVQKAESERYANPVTYTLGLVAALLAGALGVMLFRRSRPSEESWFASAIDEPSLAASSAPGSADSLFGAAVSAPPPPAADDAAKSTLVLDDSRFATQQTGTTLLSPETQPALTEQRREVSVEELIDLEQQAEFFVVLGQDEAAIDLLMSHLRNTGGISPLPYLKLLEIYHRRGDHEAYERMRDRFNRRFNAYAPEWGADLTHGRSLEDYPDVMRTLEAMWPTPQRAMLELESLLFRRDDGETFDVPAYGEVLFLYSMARDLSEHEVSMTTQPTVEMENVDFLLPLDDDPNASGGSLYRPMISTIPMESNPSIEKPLTLDFDISNFGEPDSPFKKS